MKYELPTIIYQEKDCVKNHGTELAAMGKHAYIITGKSSSRKNGSLEDTVTTLENCGVQITIFDEIEENPSVETCIKAAEIGMRENVDFCIGIGGGSPLDASKAIALLIGNHTLDGEIFYQTTDLGKNALPVVSIPTTAGTGSEATPYAILTIHAKQTKQSISYRIFPNLALCDAKYLKTAPKSVLISTTVDTLAHLVESYLNTNASVYSRMFCEKALVLWGSIREKLCMLARTGENLLTDAEYENMMAASTVAGMAISHTATGLPHGLSYPVTYDTGLSHGLACGLFLPGFLAFCEQKEMQGEKAKADVVCQGDVAKLLCLLGLNDLTEFKEMMLTLLDGHVIPKDQWGDIVDTVLQNPAKMKNCPYEISKEELTAWNYKF